MNQQSLPPIKDRFSINVIENRSSELLLLKRSKTTNFGPGLWGFSAGHIEAGESAETCALRELEEEIGANFSIERLAILEPVRDHYYGGVYEINLFHHRWLGGEVELNHEHSQYAWVNRQDYKRYAVMDGIDEDIRYLDIWPLEFLNKDKLPNFPNHL